MKSIYLAISEVDSTFDTEEKRKALHDAIRKLSAKEQRVLELRYDKHLPVKDIAKELVISVSVVYSIHNRAITILRKKFTPEYFKAMYKVLYGDKADQMHYKDSQW